MTNFSVFGMSVPVNAAGGRRHRAGRASTIGRLSAGAATASGGKKEK